MYYEPCLQLNVMSCSSLDQQGITVTFRNLKYLLSDRHDRNMILCAMLKNERDGLFKSRLQQPNRRARVSIESSRARRNYNETARNMPGHLWHQCLGHVYEDTANRMILDETYGMKTCDKPLDRLCDACECTKRTRFPSNGDLIDRSDDRTNHADICGPFRNATIAGNRYFLPTTTTPHPYTEVKVLEKRREAGQHLFNFEAWLERDTGKSVKHIHTDNAKEFTATHLRLRTMAINHTCISAYSS